MDSSFNFVFVGAVEFSWHALEALLQAGARPALVCTLRQDLSHRHSDWRDIGELAQRHGVPVLRFDNINEPDVVARIAQTSPDYLLVIGWSQLLRGDLLALPRRGSIGFHPTALPEGRGRAPIPWTILSGTRRSGASVMHLAEDADAGDLAAQRLFDLAPRETATTLYARAAEALGDMMAEIAGCLTAGEPIPGTPQDHAAASWYAKRTPEDGWIDWARPAEEIDRLVRASTRPYPGAFTVTPKRERLVVWAAEPVEDCRHRGTIGQVVAYDGETAIVQCGAGALRITEAQAQSGEAGPPRRMLGPVHGKLGLPPERIWRLLSEE